MSRAHYRAVALLMLHHQAMGGRPTWVPPRVTLPPPLAVSEPARPWYARAWAWLLARYHLTGWQEP